MKFFKIVMFAILVPLFVHAQTDVVGNWKMEWDENEMHHTLKFTISSDGTYLVDMEMDGKVDVKGKYELTDSEITIWDTEGEYACSSDKKGVYKIMVNADSMTMTRLSDDCKERGSPSGEMVFQRVDS